jgi:hypothetical protein
VIVGGPGLNVHLCTVGSQRSLPDADAVGAHLSESRLHHSDSARCAPHSEREGGGRRHCIAAPSGGIARRSKTIYLEEALEAALGESSDIRVQNRAGEVNAEKKGAVQKAKRSGAVKASKQKKVPAANGGPMPASEDGQLEQRMGRFLVS